MVILGLQDNQLRREYRGNPGYFYPPESHGRLKKYIQAKYAGRQNDYISRSTRRLQPTSAA